LVGSAGQEQEPDGQAEADSVLVEHVTKQHGQSEDQRQAEGAVLQGALVMLDVAEDQTQARSQAARKQDQKGLEGCYCGPWCRRLGSLFFGLGRGGLTLLSPLAFGPACHRLSTCFPLMMGRGRHQTASQGQHQRVLHHRIEDKRSY
jgi:hypothetical protein